MPIFRIKIHRFGLVSHPSSPLLPIHILLWVLGRLAK